MKSPAFRFYPSDFWGSPDVQAMDLHEVAAYLSLLSNAWLGDRPGYLVDDDDKLRRWARMSREQWAQSRDLLLTKFPVVEEGWRANPRLAFEAEKQHAFSESQSAKGKLGGRPRKATEKPRLSNENPGLYSGISPEKPSVSVSVSASASERNVSLPSEAHSDELRSGNSKTGLQMVSSKGKSRNTTSKDVERVYEAYPNKVGKRVALISIERAMKKLREQDCADPAAYLIESIQAWIAKRKRDASAGKFVPDYPNPSTWFNQERYDDPQCRPQKTAASDPLEEIERQRAEAMEEIEREKAALREKQRQDGSESVQPGMSLSPDMVATTVMFETSLSGHDLRTNLTAVTRAEIGRGRGVDEVKSSLVMALSSYEQARLDGKLTKFAPKPANFIGDGLWRDAKLWPWKDGYGPTSQQRPRLAIDKLNEGMNRHLDITDLSQKPIGATA